MISRQTKVPGQTGEPLSRVRAIAGRKAVAEYQVALIERAATLIALNDGPVDADAFKVRSVAGNVSVSTLAWALEISPITLAKRVVAIRKARQQ